MPTKKEVVDDVWIKPEDSEDDDDEELDADAQETLASLEEATFVEYGDFKIKQIREAAVTNRSITDLFGLMRSKFLDLEPEYQRDVVWDESRSSALIQSLFQGYFIPPIIFNVLTKMYEGDYRHFRVCVDGKQRLTAIYKFMTGQIGVYDHNVTPKKWYYCHPLDKDGNEKESNHLILPDEAKHFFRSTKLCCYEFKALHPSIEETMFQLVQRGMPLTPAEKLRALSTNWAAFGKKYEIDYPRVINLCTQKRASGFRAIIGIFAQLMEVKSNTPGTGRSRGNREGVSYAPSLQTGANTLTRLVGKQDASLTEGAKLHFKQVFDKFQDLIDIDTTELPGQDPDYSIDQDSAFAKAPEFLREPRVGHVKTFSPLELLSTAVLISVHSRSRTNAMLLGDIKEMRHFLREHHKDLRLNNTCWATAWKFIDTELIQRRGGRGAVPKAGAANVPDAQLGIPGGATQAGANGAGSNEQNGEDDEDPDEDIYNATPRAATRRTRPGVNGHGNDSPVATSNGNGANSANSVDGVNGTNGGANGRNGVRVARRGRGGSTRASARHHSAAPGDATPGQRRRRVDTNPDAAGGGVHKRARGGG